MTSIRLRTVLKSAVLSNYKNIYAVNGEQTLVPLLIDTRKSAGTVKPVLITIRNAGTGKAGKVGRRVVKNGGISLAVSLNESHEIVAKCMQLYNKIITIAVAKAS